MFEATRPCKDAPKHESTIIVGYSSYDLYYAFATKRRVVSFGGAVTVHKLWQPDEEAALPGAGFTEDAVVDKVPFKCTPGRKRVSAFGGTPSGGWAMEVGRPWMVASVPAG